MPFKSPGPRLASYSRVYSKGWSQYLPEAQTSSDVAQWGDKLNMNPSRLGPTLVNVDTGSDNMGERTAEKGVAPTIKRQMGSPVRI